MGAAHHPPGAPGSSAGAPADVDWPGLVAAVMVPVVPGDGRVACQHCTARVRLIPTPGLGMTWVDQTAASPDRSIFCAAGIRHKPMPRVRALP